MKIEIKENEGKNTVVVLKGDLDTQASEQLEKTFESLLIDEGRQFLVDFSQLEFISSAGMRSLLLLKKKASEKGGNVIIEGMSENILQIFRLVGFEAMFEIR